MALQIHSKAGAFSPGSNLWVLPQLDNSGWTKTLDWYLNFQVSRMSRFTPKEMPEALKKIIEQSGVENFKPHADENSPLLIASSERLPNDQTVILKYNDKLDEWFKNIKLLWYRLNRPKMRIFLPLDIKESEIIRYWPKLEELHLVSFVPYQSEATH